jgi:hypothetical protein
MRNAWIVLLLAASCAWAYEPDSAYEARQIEGWTVRVSGILNAHPDLAAQALELLRVKLYDVTRVIPPPALEKIRTVPIWLEYQDRDIAGGVYHPSADWLRDHGFNPAKARSVEFGNAANFLTWSVVQPSMVLHELAHAYHHQVLGYDNAEIKAAYQAAVVSHRYDSVLYYRGAEKRHYALNNPMEYFAEASEAFFGTNDFYPFVRPELQQFDPRMFDVLRKVWGVR